MARTATVQTAPKAVKTPSIEIKALAAASKSEGMRMLYTAGYKVSRVAEVFNAPYGFCYGVAQRAGVVATAAARRMPKAVAPAKPAAKATKPVVAPPRTARTSATAKVKAALATKKAGRPTIATRQANRKSR